MADTSVISGSLPAMSGLKGTIAAIECYPEYQGEYEVTPKASESTILETANRVLKKNVVVGQIPYYETSNGSGTTIYIAKEVN